MTVQLGSVPASHWEPAGRLTATWSALISATAAAATPGSTTSAAAPPERCAARGAGGGARRGGRRAPGRRRAASGRAAEVSLRAPRESVAKGRETTMHADPGGGRARVEPCGDLVVGGVVAEPRRQCGTLARRQSG